MNQFFFFPLELNYEDGNQNLNCILLLGFLQKEVMTSEEKSNFILVEFLRFVFPSAWIIVLMFFNCVCQASLTHCIPVQSTVTLKITW